MAVYKVEVSASMVIPSVDLSITSQKLLCSSSPQQFALQLAIVKFSLIFLNLILPKNKIHPHHRTMNFLLVTSSLLLALSHCSSLEVPSPPAALRVRRGSGLPSGKSAGFITALSAVARGGGGETSDETSAKTGDSYDLESTSLGGSQQSSGDSSSSSPGPLDRNMVVACTNRHNCELTCAKAKTAKYSSKAAFVEALVRSIGEAALTDAHKLGLQLGRRRAPCERCALVYSNCDNEAYGIARQQLFGWRSSPDDLLSLPKSSNSL